MDLELGGLSVDYFVKTRSEKGIKKGNFRSEIPLVITATSVTF